MKFLIVDDDVAVLRVMAASLERAGHQTILSHGAHAAMADTGRDDFDFMITDLQMTGMDGEQLIVDMCNDTGLKPSRVIVVSGSADTTKRDEVLGLGVAGFIQKPVMPMTFAAQIEQIVATQP